MNEKEILENLLEKCYRFISLRPRSEKEMIRYIEKKAGKNKKITEKITNDVVDRLKDQDYINDLKFVEWWVDSRSYFRPKGQFALKAELLAKGVSKETIYIYFEDNNINELDLAKKVLVGKRRVLGDLGSMEKYKKAISLLQRRGFSYSTSKKAIEDFIKTV